MRLIQSTILSLVMAVALWGSSTALKAETVVSTSQTPQLTAFERGPGQIILK